MAEPGDLEERARSRAGSNGSSRRASTRAYKLARDGYDLARETSDPQLMHTSGALLRVGYRAGRWTEILPVVEVHLGAFAHESDVACPEVQTGPALGAFLFANLGERDRADELTRHGRGHPKPPGRRDPGLLRRGGRPFRAGARPSAGR